MEKERRKDRRFVIDQFVEISLLKEKSIRAKGLNISKGGLLCEVDEPLDLNSRVYLMLTLQENGEEFRFTCEGIIIRCRENNNKNYAAIQFTGLSEEDKEKIEKTLR